MKEKLIEQVDNLIEIVYDSGLSFESKVKYVSDSKFSLEKIKKDLRADDFEGAIDKLKGIRASLGLGEKFEEAINSLIEDIVDFTEENQIPIHNINPKKLFLLKGGKIFSTKFILNDKSEDNNELEHKEEEILNYLYQQYKESTSHYDQRVSLYIMKKELNDPYFEEALENLKKDKLVASYLDKAEYELIGKKVKTKKEHYTYVYLTTKGVMERLGGME